MNQAQLFRLVDRAVDGRLAKILAGYRDLGLSAGRMSLRLAAEHQVEVSGPTIKKWVASLPPSKSSHTKTAQTGRTAQTAQTGRTAQTAQTAQAAQTAQSEGPDSAWSRVGVAL